MDPERKERYIRWQNHRITQFSFSINLFLTFTLASLAFVANIKLENKPHGDLPIETIIGCWAFCALFGFAATISRLLDFRYTALKIKDGGLFNTFMAEFCGPVTWGCFWGQVVTYIIGAYLLIAGVIAT
jgi:hypothetical protein